MDKVKIALVGIGGISQIVRIPTLKKMDDVELVAICDIDEAKCSVIANKFNIPNVYYDIQNLLKREQLDGILICTPNNFHYPMALASLERGIPTLVEKPLAISLDQVNRIHKKAQEKNTLLVVGMNYRFRDDAIVLKNFLEQNEIGEPYYIKSGWLRHWSRPEMQTWITDSKISGGGVIMDMGIQLLDLSLWILDRPKIQHVHAYTYNLFMQGDVEDSALAVIRTTSGAVVTIEVSWRMHLEKDVNYTHVFGKEGGAFLNPLRMYKEMHGKLVNVTPVDFEPHADIFKRSFVNEIKNFINCIRGEEEPVTPVADAVYTMKIIDAIYKSARQGKQIDFEE